jgi:CBS domain-containing protein
MKVGEFLQMSHQRLVTCIPDHALNDVAKLMYTNGIGALPVCELNDRMVGIVSERDLVRAFARNDVTELQYLRARDVMTTRVVVCRPDDTMLHAQEIMRENKFRHLPVAEDGGHVQGMLSLRDTLATRLAETEEEKNVLRDVVLAARGR